jgi:hypothetical protein
VRFPLFAVRRRCTAKSAIPVVEESRVRPPDLSGGVDRVAAVERYVGVEYLGSKRPRCELAEVRERR